MLRSRILHHLERPHQGCLDYTSVLASQRGRGVGEQA